MEVLGCSRPTIRTAIQILVDEGVLHRQPGVGTYVGLPEPRGDTQRALGLIVPTIADPCHSELAEAVEQQSSKAGYHQILGQSLYTPGGEAKCLMKFAANPCVKGLVVVPNLGDDWPLQAYRYLQERGIPVVLAVRNARAIEADVVASDNLRGAREIVHYLIGIGHRRIAYIQGVPQWLGSRFEGYRQALGGSGIPDDKDLILSLNAPARQAGREGVKVLLDRGVRFSAIFARNDATAVGVLQGLEEARIRVPDQVSVAGIDSTHISGNLVPPLTTVDTSLEEIARQAVNLLLDRVEGRFDGPARNLTIQPRLIIRGSTAPPGNSSFAFTQATGLGTSG